MYAIRSYYGNDEQLSGKHSDAYGFNSDGFNDTHLIAEYNKIAQFKWFVEEYNKVSKFFLNANYANYRKNNFL